MDELLEFGILGLGIFLLLKNTNVLTPATPIVIAPPVDPATISHPGTEYHVATDSLNPGHYYAFDVTDQKYGDIGPVIPPGDTRSLWYWDGKAFKQVQ